MRRLAGDPLLVGLIAFAVTFALTLLFLRSARRREGMQNRVLAAIGSACKYTQRVPVNNQWKCPEGTLDTGRSWGDKDGDLQCLLGCAVSPNCEYTGRTLQNKQWKCPAGWADTGLNWGVPNGDKQCQRCAPKQGCGYTQRQATKDGEWRCPPGTFDTGRDWGKPDGDKQCMTACCPSGFKGREGGTSDLFPCGPHDINRDGGIRRSSDNQKAAELISYCCQWTNKDCRHKGLSGFFQSAKDTGTRQTGYYTADDGCNVNVWDQAGGQVAVTGKGLGLWGGIGMMAAAGAGLLAAPFTGGTSLALSLSIPASVVAATQLNSRVIQKKQPGSLA